MSTMSLENIKLPLSFIKDILKIAMIDGIISKEQYNLLASLFLHYGKEEMRLKALTLKGEEPAVANID